MIALRPSKTGPKSKICLSEHVLYCIMHGSTNLHVAIQYLRERNLVICTCSSIGTWRKLSAIAKPLHVYVLKQGTLTFNHMHSAALKKYDPELVEFLVDPLRLCFAAPCVVSYAK